MIVDFESGAGGGTGAAAAAGASPSGSAVLLAGRMLTCWIFLYSGWGQIAEFAFWSGRAAEKHMPLPHLMIAASITTLTFHNFWAFEGVQRAAQIVNLNRNLAIMGGLLFIGTFGAGAYSVDAAARRSHR